MDYHQVVRVVTHQQVAAGGSMMQEERWWLDSTPTNSWKICRQQIAAVGPAVCTASVRVALTYAGGTGIAPWEPVCG
jgi:hypothetical protein